MSIIAALVIYTTTILPAGTVLEDTTVTIGASHVVYGGSMDWLPCPPKPPVIMMEITDE